MSASRPPRPIKNDYVARSGLPSASLLGRPQNGSNAATAAASIDPDEYLEKAEKEWNERVDVEVEGMANGLGELVEAFEVRASLLTASLSRSRGPGRTQGLFCTLQVLTSVFPPSCVIRSTPVRP
jgi:hypothetical protein